MISVILAGVPISTAAGNNPQRVLIGFRDNPGQEGRQLVESLGGRVIYQYDLIPVIAAEIPTRATADLRSHPRVTFVESELTRVMESHIIPGVLYTGTPEIYPWGVERVRANEVWDATPFDGDPAVAMGRPAGQGVKVAVLDSGVDTDHPDLAANLNLADSFDFVDNDSDVNDPFPPSHGTATSGIVGAVDNGIGVVGVAPKATVLQYRVCGEPVVVDCPLSAIIAGIDRAVMKGAHVISMSFGGILFSTAEKMAIHAAFVAGLVLVASAGNTPSPIAGALHYPSGFPEVIAVGATDRNNNLASFSTFGGHQELVAPGVGTPTTEAVGEAREAGLTETSPTPRTLNPNPMQFSALGTITGILVNAGLGRTSDFATADCSGGNKIALIERGLITFRSKVLNAIADGCIGAVIFNNQAGNFFGTLGSPTGITIPAVSLSRAEGLALRTEVLAPSTVTVNLAVITGDYDTFSGTSASAPYVSGVAAVVLSADPSLSNRDVRKILRGTALDLGDPGRDSLFGYGLVDAKNAVDCATGVITCELP